MSYERLKQRFAQFGQEQVFGYWEELTESERASLAGQATEVDLDELQRLLDETGRPTAEADLEPAPCVALPGDRYHDRTWVEARERGEELLRDGKVAAFTVAGGQGTRLGFDGPKGTFPVTPVRNKPLFQVFAEKIRAASNVYGVAVPWLIMTSHANHDETVKFFEDAGFLGLSREDVHFFRQGRMPAVDFDGKILLESKSRLAMSPDGHGGSLRAMVRSGALEKIRDRGVEMISYFQVDNPLVRVLDPWFVGFHAGQGSEMSSKMVRKAHAGEKVGVFCLRNGRHVVVEYSDLPDSLAGARDDRGNLRFAAGSIAIHLINTAFIERVAGGAVHEKGKLPFHSAKKKVPYVDGSGEVVSPSEANAIKFEMFVFDALPEARHPLVLETQREAEFSPVKNASGPDSVETCIRDQLKQFARWFRSAGVELPVDGNGIPLCRVEVSPLFSTDRESFRDAWSRLPEKPAIRDGLYVE